MMQPETLICGLLIAVIIGLVLMARESIRRGKVIQARLQTIRETEQALLMVDEWNCRVRVVAINGQTERWTRGVVVVTGRECIVYDRSIKVNEQSRFGWNDLRWFGRPEKYTSGHNFMWLHFEDGNGWRVVQIRLFRTAMQDLVRMLKTVVTPELVTAYRRRRPYIHVGPVKARPATQDIHGAWSVAEGIELYLMPRFLVLLEGERVLRKISLEGVQRIGALRRIDQPGADGLVRFEAEEESFAFAVKAYETFAGQLAEASKRTLEAPLERKQKGKDYDDDDWDE